MTVLEPLSDAALSCGAGPLWRHTKIAVMPHTVQQ